MTRVAVVGHVEWVQFVALARYPDRGGLESGRRVAEHAGGGAVVAATVLARLGAEVDFFCALGDDELAGTARRQLSDAGLAVHAAVSPGPTRLAFTMLDDGGERTIVTVGQRRAPSGADPLAWDRLAAADGVYFTAGDGAALAHARAARVLVLTPRAADQTGPLDRLPRVEATVFSADDAAEREWASAFAGHSRLMVGTEGDHGGSWSGESEGRWQVATPPGPVADSYGCGDSFAAGLTFGLARGEPITQATATGARAAAEMLTRVGAP